MSKLEGFKDVKIVKSCQPNVDEVKIEESCEDFERKDNFLHWCDPEILDCAPSQKFNCCLEKIKKEEEKEKDRPRLFFEGIPRKLSDRISLPINNIESLSFYESFLISKGTICDRKLFKSLRKDVETFTEVGSASIMVEELTDGNILVFQVKQTLIDGERVTHECLSVITKDLKLLHEKIIERKCSSDSSTEQSLFISSSSDKEFRLIKTQARNGAIEQLKAEVEWKKSGDFVSCGATVVMLRKLVAEGFTGCLQTHCCNIEGEFALSQFWFHKPAYCDDVNDIFLTVKRVDQLAIYGDDRIVKITNFFDNGNGRLLRQIAGDDLVVHVNPLSMEKRYTKYLEETWREDVQLLSMYLEYKAKRKEELRRKFESPPVKRVLHDYVKSLVKCMPQNIMNFTIEFIQKLDQENVNVQLQILETTDRRNQQNA